MKTFLTKNVCSKLGKTGKNSKVITIKVLCKKVHLSIQTETNTKGIFRMGNITVKALILGRMEINMLENMSMESRAAKV